MAGERRYVEESHPGTGGKTLSGLRKGTREAVGQGRGAEQNYANLSAMVTIADSTRKVVLLLAHRDGRHFNRRPSLSGIADVAGPAACPASRD
jgi:hypothetical protein